MTSGRNLVSGLTIFVVTAFAVMGCGKASSSPETNKLQDEGNARIESNRAIEHDLGAIHGIFINPGVESKPTATIAKNWVWSGYTPEQRQDIRAKLEAFIDNVDKIYDISAHRGVRIVHDQSVRASRLNAQAYLDSLNASEAATASPEKAKP